MHYVKQFNINGVNTKQVACVELHGKPNAATEGSIGVIGIDLDSPVHEVYKCVAVNGGTYTWELLSGGMSTITATISGEGVERVPFLYENLRTPPMYVVGVGDLIIDDAGHIYQVESIYSDHCIGLYSDICITPKKGSDYYTPEEKAEFVDELEREVTGDIDTALDSILDMQDFYKSGENEGFSEKLTARLKNIEDVIASLNAMFKGNDGYNILLQAYPVGSIYMSVSDVEPSTIFGGTWERLKDRFLLGASDDYLAESKGGSDTHTHGAGSLYAAISAKSSGGFLTQMNLRVGANMRNRVFVNSDTTYKNEALESEYGTAVYGSTDSSSSLPPYLAVYMWKRVA